MNALAVNKNDCMRTLSPSTQTNMIQLGGTPMESTAIPEGTAMLAGLLASVGPHGGISFQLTRKNYRAGEKGTR